MIKLKQLITEVEVPKARTAKFTNAYPDAIVPKHIDQLVSAYQKVDKNIAKQFKTLGDSYKKTLANMGKYGMEPQKWKKEFTKLEGIGKDLINFVKGNL
jgi:hypothetical protein